MQRAQIAVKLAGDLMNSQLHEYNLSHPSLSNNLLFPVVPSTINNHTGRQYWEDFTKHAKDPRLTKAWEDCLQAIKTALQQCAVDLQPIIEGEYGIVQCTQATLLRTGWSRDQIPLQNTTIKAPALACSLLPMLGKGANSRNQIHARAPPISAVIKFAKSSFMP